MNFLVLALIFPLFVGVRSYSRGAPIVACQTFSPWHVWIAFDESAAELTATKLGSTVNVTLSSDKPFKGFIVQGRDLNDEVIGHFMHDAYGNFKELNCGGITDSTITHKDDKSKYEVIAMWRIPKEVTKKTVNFKAVVVYQYRNGQKVNFELKL